MRALVLTDLDGTLLDVHTYDWTPARPALAALAQAGIPLTICTSKTRAEVEALRCELDLRDPFIVENGGAIYAPAGYFGDGFAVGTRRHGYDIVEIGLPYETLVEILATAARETQVVVRGWHEMEEDEVARRCEMTLEAARLAMAREHDEPFIVCDDRPDEVARLAAEVARHGARLTRGDRFFHIIGPHDKGAAARHVVDLFAKSWGPVKTLAIGDALNDVPMLALADAAVVIASPQAEAVAARIPGARLTTEPGPAGWNHAVLTWLERDVGCGVPLN